VSFLPERNRQHERHDRATDEHRADNHDECHPPTRRPETPHAHRREQVTRAIIRAGQRNRRPTTGGVPAEPAPHLNGVANARVVLRQPPITHALAIGAPTTGLHL